MREDEWEEGEESGGEYVFLSFEKKNVFYHCENYFPPFTNQIKENWKTTFLRKSFTPNQTGSKLAGVELITEASAMYEEKSLG